jgi:hypothetical protein
MEETEKQVAEETGESGNKKKVKKAQLTSLLSKIIGISFLVTMYTLNCLKMVTLNVNELVEVTVTIVSLCSTIDINIFVDKILSYKKEK